MVDIKGWFDIVVKTIIAASVAYGGWYLGFQKQDSEERHTSEQQQTDDIRFIVHMVTSPDPVRRTMGVAIVTAYADSKPERVPRQLADAVIVAECLGGYAGRSHAAGRRTARLGWFPQRFGRSPWPVSKA